MFPSPITLLHFFPCTDFSTTALPSSWANPSNYTPKLSPATRIPSSPLRTPTTPILPMEPARRRFCLLPRKRRKSLRIERRSCTVTSLYTPRHPKTRLAIKHTLTSEDLTRRLERTNETLYPIRRRPHNHLRHREGEKENASHISPSHLLNQPSTSSRCNNKSSISSSLSNSDTMCLYYNLQESITFLSPLGTYTHTLSLPSLKRRTRKERRGTVCCTPNFNYSCILSNGRTDSDSGARGGNGDMCVRIPGFAAFLCLLFVLCVCE